MSDNVNHPSHYTDGKIEVIDFIEDKGLNFHRGNAVKYIARAGKKNPDKEVEDLEKAVWYLKREIERKIGGKIKQHKISLESSITENKFFMLIDETFCIEIKEKTFYELAEFLSIKVK